jgi:hypothetical protein
MSLYFFLHDADFFLGQVCPALADCWRQRRFTPCGPLAAVLRPAVRAFTERFHTRAGEAVLALVESGLPFDHDTWRLLVGEILLYGARAIPEIQTAPETLTCLLAPNSSPQGEEVRSRFPPIQQAHFGTRDLVFGGGYYRPEHAGWNDLVDVARLADYLTAVDPDRWVVEDLLPLREIKEDEERADELEFAREWFPQLVNLYRKAREQKQIVVSEVVQSAGLD